MNHLNEMMEQLGTQARSASALLATATSRQKDDALRHAAAAMRRHAATILTANQRDMDAASAQALSPAMLERLRLDESRIEAMAKGIDDIASLPDPVGKILERRDGLSNGLLIEKVSVPLGVIGIIYESRPNVTADAGALCLKSGNACILRCGSESAASSAAIAAALHAGLEEAGLSAHAIQLVPTQDREAVGIMLGMVQHIDVIIPRGGKSLTKRVAEESRVPTILHLDGNCHTYIHTAADADRAVSLVVNAKMRRTGICGATESLLIDAAIIDSILPKIADRLLGMGCNIRGDARAQAADDRIDRASEEDWSTEYLDAILSVKTVASLDDAIAHINRYGSHHTDAIVTEDRLAAKRFCERVDSAIVMVNTSTQFADGGEFGMGAEIGISTGRLHARGPVGCEQLTTYKYLVTSNGAVRA